VVSLERSDSSLCVGVILRIENVLVVCRVNLCRPAPKSHEPGHSARYVERISGRSRRGLLRIAGTSPGGPTRSRIARKSVPLDQDRIRLGSCIVESSVWARIDANFEQRDQAIRPEESARWPVSHLPVVGPHVGAVWFRLNRYACAVREVPEPTVGGVLRGARRSRAMRVAPKSHV